MLDLAIIIVNYNTRDLLRNCLTSIYHSQGELGYKVIVVDNASPDGSAAMVRAEFPQTDLIASQINGGFAAANNLGLRRVGFAADGTPGPGTPRYGLLLNPDTVLPVTALADMISFMDEIIQLHSMRKLLEIDDESFTVATGDGSVIINSAQPPGQKKLKSAEFIALMNIEIGSRFSS